MSYRMISSLVALILFLVVGFLQQNHISKQKVQISKLSDEKLILENKTALCNSYLEKQNIQIKALSLDMSKTLKKPKQVEKIQKVYIKDKSCKGELDAYKELFNSSF